MDIQQHVPQSKEQWIGFVAFFVMQMVLEFFIGKTKRTPASSILELVALLGKQLVLRIFRKGEKKNE